MHLRTPLARKNLCAPEHCSGLCLARGVVLQLVVQTYHRLLSAFGTFITNAYSTHFVKSSGLNANAKFPTCRKEECTISLPLCHNAPQAARVP